MPDVVAAAACLRVVAGLPQAGREALRCEVGAPGVGVRVRGAEGGLGVGLLTPPFELEAVAREELRAVVEVPLTLLLLCCP